MAVRKGSERFGAEPRPVTGGRDLGVSPEFDSGLARAAADRWRQADGLLPDSVAHVTRRPPITHADLFPADAKPSRLRVALYGAVAAVALIGGGTVLALLFAPGGSEPEVGQQVAAARPSAAVMVETASDAPTEAPILRTPAAEAPVPVSAAPRAAEGRSEPVTEAIPAPAAQPPVDATTTGTAPQARWMERWSADAEPGAAAEPSNSAARVPERESESGEDLRETLRAAEPAVRQDAAPDAAPAPASASAVAQAPAVRVVGPGADATAGTQAASEASAPQTIAPPPAVASVPAAPEIASPDVASAEPAAGEPAPAPLVETPAAQGEPVAPAEPAAESAALPPAQGGQSGRIVSAVNLRASGEKGAAILGTVAGGTELQVIGCDLWCEIVTPDGRRGFVFKDFVSTAR